MKMNNVKKRELRVLIRRAIKYQNSRTLFSCKDCQFCSGTCELDAANGIDVSLRQASTLPECFLFETMYSAFASALDEMLELGINFHQATYGWPTVVSRLVARADRYGYIMPLRQRNLERYG